MANRDKGLSRLAEPRHVNAIETRSKRAPRGNLNGASSEAWLKRDAVEYRTLGSRPRRVRSGELDLDVIKWRYV